MLGNQVVPLCNYVHDRYYMCKIKIKRVPNYLEKTIHRQYFYLIRNESIVLISFHAQHKTKQHSITNKFRGKGGEQRGASIQYPHQKFTYE